MADLPSVISILDCSNEASTLVQDDSLTFTVTEDNDGIPCAYIIHVPVSTGTELLNETVCQTNIVPHDDIKPAIESLGLVNLNGQDCIVTSVSDPIIITTTAHPIMTNQSSGITVTTGAAETFSLGEVLLKNETYNDDKNEVSVKLETKPESPIDSSPTNNLILQSDTSPVQTLDDKGRDHTENNKTGVSENESVNKQEKITVSNLPNCKRPIQTYGKKKSKVSNCSEKASGGCTTTVSNTSDKLISVDSKLTCGNIVVSTPDRISIKIRPRKRRLILDSPRQIPIGDFKLQLKNTRDIVLEKQDMAPPTKKAMKLMEHSHVGKIFCTPGRDLKHVPLYRLFYSRLVIAPETKHRPVNSLVPLNSDLRIPQPGSLNDVFLEEFDSSEFSMLREKVYSTNRNQKSPKLSFKGAKNPLAFKHYTTKKRKFSEHSKTITVKEERSEARSTPIDEHDRVTVTQEDLPMTFDVSTADNAKVDHRKSASNPVNNPNEEIQEISREEPCISIKNENAGSQIQVKEEVCNPQNPKIEVE